MKTNKRKAAVGIGHTTDINDVSAISIYEKNNNEPRQNRECKPFKIEEQIIDDY